jgi:hypothetical protein
MAHPIEHSLAIIRTGNALKLPDNQQWTNRFEVHSETSNRVYTIAQHKKNRYWGCSCFGWIRFKHCKHLSAVGIPSDMRPYEAVLSE